MGSVAGTLAPTTEVANSSLKAFPALNGEAFSCKKTASREVMKVRAVSRKPVSRPEGALTL